MARSDSVVDICVAPHREQWFPGSPNLDLNPFGRAQTNKTKPCSCCRCSTNGCAPSWSHILDKSARKGAGYVVNYDGRSVLDVDTAWKTMLRNRGVAKWDLGGFMGHDVSGSTETYAIGRLDTVYRPLDDILGEVERFAPGSITPKLRRTVPIRHFPPGGENDRIEPIQWWAWQGLNLRPLRCQHSALPLSYTPAGRLH